MTTKLETFEEALKKRFAAKLKERDANEVIRKAQAELEKVKTEIEQADDALEKARKECEEAMAERPTGGIARR